MHLRTKVTLSLLAVGIFLVISTGFYLHLFVKKSFEDEVMGNLRIFSGINERLYYTFIEQLMTRTLDWSSDNYIKSLTEDILDTKLSSQKHKEAVEAFARYLKDKKMKADPSVLLVELLDEQGFVVASTDPARIGKNELDEEHAFQAHHFSSAIVAPFRAVFASSPVFEADESAEPMLHLMTRAFSTEQDENGNFVPLPGVLFIHFTAIDRLVSSLVGETESSEIGAPETIDPKLVKNFSMYLVNKDKRVVASNVVGFDPLRFSPDTAGIIDHCFSGGVGDIIHYTDGRGVPMLAASVCIQNDKTVLVSEISEQDAYVSYSQLAFFTMAFTSLIIPGAFILFFLLGRRPLRYLEIITEQAEKVSQGDFGVRVPNFGMDEIGLLGRTFNSMIEKLQLSQSNLVMTSNRLKRELANIEHDLAKHESDEKFAAQSKRATLNLLEDTWKTKEKLEAEERRLQAVLGSIAVGFVLLDREYRVQLVNAKIEQLFGFSAKELLDKDLRTLLTITGADAKPIDSERWPMERMFLTGMGVVSTLQDRLSIITPRRETPLAVVITATPFRGAGADGVVGAVVVIRDATEERAVDDVKSGFISVASHQLRTPLTTIRWYSEMLLDEDTGSLTGTQHEFLKEIHDGSKRLYQTIDLLLSISRIESGSLKVEKSPIDLIAFTDQVIKELAPQFTEKGLSFSTVPCSRESSIVWLDPLMLRQVVLNLFSNAIRYTPKGGVVNACWIVRNDPKEVVYSVSDTGIGIPEAQRSRVFTKFFRAENAITEVPDGSGLGLSLVKELVESWGGKITFESNGGKGTTFHFTIPLTSTPEPIEEKASRDTIEKK